MAGTAQGDRARRDASRRFFGILPLRPEAGQLAAIQAVAPSLGVELSPIDVRDAGEIERAIIAFARVREWRSDRHRRAHRRKFIAN